MHVHLGPLLSWPMAIDSGGHVLLLAAIVARERLCYVKPWPGTAQHREGRHCPRLMPCSRNARREDSCSLTLSGVG
jgi:hypothetical protein